jgi:hypothetical protein
MSLIYLEYDFNILYRELSIRYQALFFISTRRSDRFINISFQMKSKQRNVFYGVMIIRFNKSLHNDKGIVRYLEFFGELGQLNLISKEVFVN